MSNKNQSKNNQADGKVEATEMSDLAKQAAYAITLGFQVNTDEKGEPLTASLGEQQWTVEAGDFLTWAEKTWENHNHSQDDKKGPETETVVGDLPENPNGEGTEGGLKAESNPELVKPLDPTVQVELNQELDAAGDRGTNPPIDHERRGGLVAEINDNNEVVSVKRAEPAEADLATDGVQLSVFQTRMAWVVAHGTTHEKYVKNVMENYVKVCLTSIDLNTIAVEQKRFWRLLTYIHAHPQEFSKLFTLVLEFAREYKEQLFNLHMLYRGQNGLAMDQNELQCYNNLRTLILNTIEVRNKGQVKKLLDIRKIVENDLIPEDVRGMYVAFYQ